MTNELRGKKIEVCCDEPAESEDYACNKCGGDIRGLKCCSWKHCAVWIDGVLQPRPKEAL